MLALANTARRRPKSASLKGCDHLFRAAGNFDKKHTDATRVEGFHGARTDSAAYYGVAVLQRSDESGVAVTFGGAIARSASVSMTTRIDTGLDESHLPIVGFEDEELAAGSKVSGNVDSIVCRYSDLHVRFSLADTDQSKHPTASP